jgi:Ca2+-binding RTX toxin-like protein
LLLALAVIGTTTIMMMVVGGNSSSIGNGTCQAWADKIEGTEGPDFIVGTPRNDNIDSKGGNDENFGDTFVGDGSGDDKINSGKGGDNNFGDTAFGTGTGDDKINAGQGDDQLTGGGGADKFQCGNGEDTITDFNAAEGDKATNYLSPPLSPSSSKYALEPCWCFLFLLLAISTSFKLVTIEPLTTNELLTGSPCWRAT